MFLGGPNLYQAATYLLWPYFNVLLEGQTCIKQPLIFCDSISMFPWRAKPVLSNHLSFVTLLLEDHRRQVWLKWLIDFEGSG
jgi:hypothetical protein